MIELYINRQLVDLNRGGFDIRLNRKLTEVQNFERRSGDFSFSLTLPCTKTNNKIFEQANEPHQINKFRRPSDFEAELFAQGEKILTGFFRLTSIDPEGYNGNLYGLSISWADELEGVNLRELPWSVPYTGPGIGADQIDGYNSAVNAPVRFPLISYFPFPNNNPATPPTFLTPTTIFQADKLPPMISLKETIKQAFLSIGWAVTGSMFSEDWFKNIYLPYVDGNFPPMNYGGLAGADLDTIAGLRNFTNTAPPDQSTPPPGPNPNSGYEYLVDFIDVINQTPTVSTFNNLGNGNLQTNLAGDFVAEVELRSPFLHKIKTVTGLDYSPRFAIILVDANLPFPFANINGYLTGAAPFISQTPAILGFYDIATGYAPENANGLTPQVIFNDYVTTTDTINEVEGSGTLTKVRFPFTARAGQNVIPLIATFIDDSAQTLSEWAVFGGASWRMNPGADVDLFPAKFLPDVNAKVFVKSIIENFNLWFTTDAENKTVSFFTIDEFFKGNEAAVDLDCFGDIFGGQISPNLTAREIALRYKNDENDRITNNTEFADLSVNFKTVYSQGEKTIESLFAATGRGPAVDTVTNTRFTVLYIQTPGFLDVSPDNVAFFGGFQPRIVQHSGQLAGVTFPMQSAAGPVAVTVSLATFDGAAPFESLSATGLNLRFNNFEGLAPGIYERFFREWVDLLQKSHVIELDGVMTPAEFRSLTLDTPVELNGEIWFLLEIVGFSPLTGNAKLKLIKKVF